MSRVENWFAKYAVEIRRYIDRNHHRHDEADDLLHEVFLVALKKNNDYRENGHAKAYLYRIAKNLVLASRRKRKPVNNLESVEVIDDSEEGKRQQQDEHELLGSIRQDLNHIRPDQRQVILLRIEKGMSFKAIAEFLEISPNTVISHFHRGITRLRKLARRR